MRIIIGSIFLFNFLFSQGFIHVENGEIVDGSSIPVLLRGLGLGGWLVPEGYMLNIPGFGSPTEIENKIEACHTLAKTNNRKSRIRFHYG